MNFVKLVEPGDTFIPTFTNSDDKVQITTLIVGQVDL